MSMKNLSNVFQTQGQLSVITTFHFRFHENSMSKMSNSKPDSNSGKWFL